MKIICQACQSKYTIADDKIQGKVAKIRCRQCGATVLIDGSASGGAHTDGAITTSAAPAAGVWLVNVADGDQRSMRTQEIVDAYNMGQITAETVVWKDGMSDWLPIGQVQEIIDAVTNASHAAAASPAGPVAGYQAPAGAAVRQAPRARAGDLFKGGAPDEEIKPSAEAAPAAPPKSASSHGDESSNIFSLGALTSSAAAPPAAFVPLASGSRGREDSGVIDLNALAKAQAARAAEPVAAAAPPQFMFPAALGQMQQPAPILDIPEPPKRSSMPKIVAIGVVVALGVVGVLIFAGHKEEPPPAPPTPVVTTPPPPPPEPVPTTTASAPAPVDSAASSKTAKKVVGGGGKVGGGKKGGGGATGPETVVPPPVKKSGACGCAPGDMQCNIRCSATGK